MLKRFVVAAAAIALVGGVSIGTAGAVDEHAPHGGASHAHHIHTANGECNDHPVNMEGGSRGLHQGSNASGPDHGMWHGSCATHNNHG